jgi:hypothetical protein
VLTHLHLLYLQPDWSFSRRLQGSFHQFIHTLTEISFPQKYHNPIDR